MLFKIYHYDAINSSDFKFISVCDGMCLSKYRSSLIGNYITANVKELFKIPSSTYLSLNKFDGLDGRINFEVYVDGFVKYIANEIISVDNLALRMKDRERVRQANEKAREMNGYIYGSSQIADNSSWWANRSAHDRASTGYIMAGNRRSNTIQEYIQNRNQNVTEYIAGTTNNTATWNNTAVHNYSITASQANTTDVTAYRHYADIILGANAGARRIIE